ncbi:hypothetical protein Noda2021_05300 [Candidatus Dependentiae bacterium Noda2021]|nr:hypothetical protein Noda2021_05300 [Candidatus Dependentiae bacterium Noda2021]
MVFKKAIAVLYILLGTPALSALNGNPNFFDKTQLYITSSPLVTPLRKLLQFITPLLNPHLKIKDCLANDDLQKIAQEAQTAVGIPTTQQVPLKRAEGTSFTGLEFYAATNCNGIFINQNSLAFKSYGLIRNVLHHEAIHYKYDDSIMAALLAGASCLTIDKISTKLIVRYIKGGPKSNIMAVICSLSAAVSAFGIVHRFNLYAEHRADIQGAYATQCYKCVKEKIDYYNDTLCSHGYASNKEFEAIKKILKKKHLLCKHHAKKVMHS